MKQQKNASKVHSNISRRSFVKTTSASFAVLASIGGLGVLVKNEPMLRPPGGQDESLFLAQCNRCGRCVSACPTQAIGIVSIAEGLASVRTPVMKFNLGICDFCGACVRVCPTGALQQFDVEAAGAGDVRVARVGVASIDRETCLAWVSSSCNQCFEKCPYHAIELDSRRLPYIVESRCNGCGVCENVCPVLALRSYIGGNNRAIRVRPLSEGKEAPDEC